jgi:hypothetical protein
MPNMSKPFVRLENPSPKSVQKERRASPKQQAIKLAIRLNEGVNEALRSLIRYRGDLSAMALEAIGAVDLARVTLVSADERMVRDTTITMPRALHRRLREIADDRATSMNILVNTALAHWLAGKDLLKLT